jgi:hypothetical protein
MRRAAAPACPAARTGGYRLRASCGGFGDCAEGCGVIDRPDLQPHKRGLRRDIGEAATVGAPLGQARPDARTRDTALSTV